ncbi:MAG: hypothetical protein NC819_03510 [Candidatus Omnitrophica bacterium]|nr:hypothetical protein [Candidatus Omnitrophota bacterium]
MKNPWRMTAGLVIAGAAILSAGQWPSLPYFLDSYYHLSVIQGFREAGGPVLTSFWESAPAGRPHLYPPLFHLLFLPLSLLNVHPITLARIWCWLSFPLLLAACWLAFKAVARERTAALTVMALAAPFSFYLGAVNYLPATLALIEILGLMVCLDRKRWLAGGILLGLVFWTHLGLSWLTAFSLLLFGLMEPTRRKESWKILGIGLLVASPWLFHMGHHLELFEPQPRGEENYLDTSPLMILLGLLGLIPAWRRPFPLSRFLVALAVGFLLMAAGYRFRYFAAQGLFTWLLLAGLFLDRLAEKGGFRTAGTIGIILLLAAPALTGSLAERRLRWSWADTTFLSLSAEPRVERPYGKSLFNRKHIGELAETLERQTQPDELFTCNLNYLGGMLHVLTGRAMTNEMLREMPERSLLEQARWSRALVWLKAGQGRLTGGKNLRELTEQEGLQFAEETETALIFRNPAPDPAGKKRVPAPVLPWWAACGILVVLAGTVIWDFLGGLNFRKGA